MIKRKNNLIYSGVLLILSGFISGCITTEYNPATHRQDTFFYSTESEMNIGQNVHKQILREFDLSNNPAEIERINRLGQKIAAVCDRKDISYYFYVLEGEKKSKETQKELNAFSIPGGYVYVYKSLLNAVKNDDELAFILAHEIGHIAARHGIKRLQAAMGYNLAVIASIGVTRDAEFSQGLSFALAQIIMGYSQEDEFNADEQAARYIQSIGLSPVAGISVLETLYQDDKKHIRELSLFKSHPYVPQRIRNIKEKLRLPLDLNDYLNKY
jgi:predicted Zn-dependent protease